MPVALRSSHPRGLADASKPRRQPSSRSATGTQYHSRDTESTGSLLHADSHGGSRSDGIVASRVVTDPTDRKSFLAQIEQALSPALRPGGIVVMDNRGCHKNGAVRKAIEDER